jgi:hypothetical protein
MNNNGCGYTGARQTRGTCWFYSVINGFMLSENGVKILYAKLKAYYESLNQTGKNYFNQAINAPCPTNIARTNPLYFWKFIDQFLCFRSGPRSILLRSEKSGRLLSGVNLANRQAINAHGAFPQEQIDRILNHLGFRGEYEHVGRGTQRFNAPRNVKFIIVSKKTRSASDMSQIPPSLLADPNYSLMYAVISIADESRNYNNPPGHVITGFICNKTQYLFDSNNGKIMRCDWLEPTTLRAFVRRRIVPEYKQLKNAQILVVKYALAVFARKDYVKNISPSCRLRHNRNAAIPLRFQLNLSNRTLGPRLNAGEFMNIPPKWRMALKKAWLESNYRKNVYMNKPIYDTVLRNATSEVNAYMRLWALERNHKYKQNLAGQEYQNFKAALKKKFP